MAVEIGLIAVGLCLLLLVPPVNRDAPPEEPAILDRDPTVPVNAWIGRVLGFSAVAFGAVSLILRA